MIQPLNDKLYDYNYKDAFKDCEVEDAISMVEEDHPDYLRSKLLNQIDYEVIDVEDPETIRKEYNKYHSRKLKRVLEPVSDSEKHSQASNELKLISHVRSQDSLSEENIFQGFLYKFNKLGSKKYLTKW